MSEQVLFACTVYDMCKQQDCLTPNCGHPSRGKYLISPARNDMNFDVVFNAPTDTSFITPPDEIFYVPYIYKYVNVVDDSLETVLTVKDYKENHYQKGYYDLEIEYRFEYILEFSDMYYKPLPVYIQGQPVYQIKAFSTYTKNVTLFGGDVKNKIATLTSTGAQCNSRFPEYNIQASAEIIDAEMVKVTCLTCNDTVDQNKNNLSPTGAYVVSVTIGLFTIISLYRCGRVNVLTGSPVEIPTCHHCFDPCEDFGGQVFPYDLFNAEKST